MIKYVPYMFLFEKQSPLMLIVQIYYLTLNARSLTRPMCFDLSRDALRSYRVSLASYVFSPIKSEVLGLKCVFEHQDMQMFGPKLNRYG